MMRKPRGGPNTLHRGKKPKLRKDPAAVSLGAKGGRIGGPARAASLTKSKRTQIAKHSANSRWGNRTSYQKPAYYLRKVR